MLERFLARILKMHGSPAMNSPLKNRYLNAQCWSACLAHYTLQELLSAIPLGGVRITKGKEMHWKAAVVWQHLRRKMFARRGKFLSPWAFCINELCSIVMLLLNGREMLMKKVHQRCKSSAYTTECTMGFLKLSSNSNGEAHFCMYGRKLTCFHHHT